MKKKINTKIKFRGFSLIELLATIFILSIIAGLIVYNVIGYINNSENTGQELSYSNIVKSGSQYINENLSNIAWVVNKILNEHNQDETEFTCVSVISLVNAGYFTKDIFKNKAISEYSYIKITRDTKNKTIINEEMDKEGETAIDEECSQYYVHIPKCTNAIYNGYNQKLVDVPLNKNYYTAYMKDSSGQYYENNTAIDYSPTGYQVQLKLNDEDKIWSDGKKGDTRDLTCNINRKKITIKLNNLTLHEDNFNANKYIGDKKEILKYINNNAKGLITSLHSITNIELEKISDTKIRPSEATINDITTKNNVTNNYLFDYKDSDLTIYTNRMKDPTSSICRNLTYNGNPQVLAIADDEYTLSHNQGTDADTYTVTAIPNEGFVWLDRTTTPRYVVCQIKKTNANNIKLADKKLQYTGSNLNFDKSDVTVSGINNSIISDSNATYSFTYYTDSRCTNTTTNHKNLGTYYGKATVKNMKNYNDGTSNCAKLDIVNKLIVTYNPNQGTVSPTTGIVYTNSPYGQLPTPSRTGYSFTNWYSALTGGTIVTKDTTVTNMNNHSIYARWTPNTYTLSYDSRGGTNCSSKKVTYDSTYGNLCSTSRTGYIFDDWYTASSGGSRVTSSTTVKTDRDHTLYARWTARSYTLSYDNNGGSGCYSKTIYYDSTYGSLCTPSRTGYSFDGWYTSSSGGSRVTSNTYVSRTENHTLYAHWSRNFSCSSSGSKINYADKYWTVISNTSDYCYLALNELSERTGSYNNAISNLTSEYVTGKSTAFAKEVNNGLATILGSNSKNTNLSSGDYAYWIDQNKVYDSQNRYKYSGSSSCLYSQSYSQGSISCSSYNTESSQSIATWSGERYANSSDSSYTITNGNQSYYSLSGYRSPKMTKYTFAKDGCSNSDKADADHITYHVNAAGPNNYTDPNFHRTNSRKLVIQMCGTSNYGGTATFTAKDKNSYTKSIAGSTSTLNYSSRVTYSFAGAIGSTESSSQNTYNFSDSRVCSNTYKSYSFSNKTIYYKYRLYVRVRNY